MRHPPFQHSMRLISTSRPKHRPNSLPHLNAASEVHMVNVSKKTITHRVAAAAGNITFSSPETLHAVQNHHLKKGDVLAVARVAGIQAVKKTSEIIPLAHSGLPIESVELNLDVLAPASTSDSDIHSASSNESERGEQPTRAEEISGGESSISKITAAGADLLDRQSNIKGSVHGGISITCKVETTAKTGVEMEALTGVMGAALTIVDMIKALDKGVAIENVRVIGKKGGRSGAYGCFANEK